MAALCVFSASGMACSVTPDRVNSTETGRSERDEQLRVVCHRIGDTVMPAVEAGVDQLPNVTGVQVGARRANRSAAIIAPGQDVMSPAEIVGGLQADGASAEAAPLRGVPPGVETRGCSPPNHLCEYGAVVDFGWRSC
jgi:hypothetical protein